MKNRALKGNLDLARRIRAAGRPIYIAEDDEAAPCIPPDTLRVYQVGGVYESSAFDWGGGTGFKIYLVITNNRPAFAISALELELPWKTTDFHWLEDPVVLGGHSPCYRFVGDNILEFERSLVINHYVDVTKTLSAGQSLKGFLLGFGCDPIPGEFRHGAMIPGFLIIRDQGGNEHRSAVLLRADRTQTNRVPTRRTARRQGGLLDKRDPIVRG